MERIKFYQLATQHTPTCYQQGQWIDGTMMKRLEEALARYLGVEYIVLTNSGTSSLFAAYWVLRNEFRSVTVDPYTFPATYQPARVLGYEVEYTRRVLNKNVVYQPNTLNTVVHLFGQPMGFPFNNSSSTTIIEDVAQAFGAEHQGKKLGSYGLISCFSFYPTKIFHTCGHGGAIATNDRTIYEKLKTFTECGRVNGQMTEAVALNLRMDELKAEFLLRELEHFDENVEIQRGIAQEFKKLVRGDQPFLDEQPGDRHVFSIFNMLISKRDEFRAFMDQRGIDTLIYYGQDMLPPTERPKYVDITSRIVAVPCRWSLKKEEVERIKEALGAWFMEYGNE